MRLRQAHARRLRLGDLDHLVFYLLQSTSFTSLPSIEPALSAKALVEGLGERARETFLRTGEAARPHVSADVRARIARAARALAHPRETRVAFIFGSLVKGTFADAKDREPDLVREYLLVMRFVYEKEFVAQRSPRRAEAVADLYRSRGLEHRHGGRGGLPRVDRPRHRQGRSIPTVHPPGAHRRSGLESGAQNGAPRNGPAGKLPAMGGHGRARVGSASRASGTWRWWPPTSIHEWCRTCGARVRRHRG